MLAEVYVGGGLEGGLQVVRRRHGRRLGLGVGVGGSRVLGLGLGVAVGAERRVVVMASCRGRRDQRGPCGWRGGQVEAVGAEVEGGVGRSRAGGGLGRRGGGLVEVGRDGGFHEVLAEGGALVPELAAGLVEEVSEARAHEPVVGGLAAQMAGGACGARERREAA